MAEIKQRVQKWDNLKFFLIFLVVLGHFSDKYTDISPFARGLYFYIYTFHMPLFLFISGLFSKNNIKYKRYDKIFSYFALYLIIKVLQMIQVMITKEEFKFNLFSETSSPWYALALFAFCLFTILIKNVSPKYVFIFSIALALVIGYDKSVTSFLSMARLINFYPFFYAGFCFDANKVLEFLSQKKIRIISACCFVILALIVIFKLDSVYWLRPLITCKNPYTSLDDNQPFGALLRLGYYVVAFTMSAAAISIVPKKIGNGTVAKMGSRSLQVYAMHNFVVKLIYGLVNENSYFATHVWVIFPLTIATTLLFSMDFFKPVFDLLLHPKINKEKQD